LALWFLAGLKNVRTVSLSNTLAEQFAVDRSSKYRALCWLEDAGLISVQRKVGRAPIVTLNDARTG